MHYELLHGDCVAMMSLFVPDESVDSIVTDPPYELGFMGKGWDSTGIANSVEMWREAWRVLRPGGHLLAFSGTRTYHRMVCAIEDAGFEVRDQIGWAYGSGFPKSLDVSKAIDKAAGAERPVIGNTGRDPYRMVKFKEQDGVKRSPTNEDITAPTTDAARQWQGWGTALKPAWEPIVVARKPLIGTVAANVLAHGTGALNIDACRVAFENGDTTSCADSVGLGRGHDFNKADRKYGDGLGGVVAPPHALGRWPANLIHDGSDEVLAAFPQAPGQLAEASSSSSDARKTQNTYGAMQRGSGGAAPRAELDKSAARFFYCAKASKKDRNAGCEHLTAQHYSHDGRAVDIDNPYLRTGNTAGNSHPTVKPTDLMRYLCRLVTPPGGTVLDPFMGSGSTGRAAMLEGFEFIGCELSAEYLAIAEARIADAAASRLKVAA